MTNFKTEIERIEKGCGNWDDTTLVQCERECNHKHLCQICQEQKQQLLTDMKIVEDAINQLGGAYIIKNKTKEGKLNILIELKEKLGLNHSQQEIQEKGEMYCAQIDEDIGKVCGRVDDTFTAYCIKHGRSVHKIKNVGGIKNEK